MLRCALGEWRDRHLWILLFLSLVALFCVYRITLPSPIFINVGAEGDERYLGDFYLGEQGDLYPFRWTKGSSYIKIPNLGSLPLEIILGADAPRPEGQPLPKVSLIANGTVLADLTMESGPSAHRFLYHPPLLPLPRDLLLEVKSDTFVPPGDGRALGIVLNSVEIKPVSSPFYLFQVCLVSSLMGSLSMVFGYLLLRWLEVSRMKSLVCGIVILTLLGLGIVQQFIVMRVLVIVLGLLLVSYLLAILLEIMGYREVLLTRSGLRRKPLETWTGNPVALIYHSMKAQALSYSQSRRLSDVLPAYLPAVVLFILMPFALYLPNQSILDNNLTLVIPYLVLAVVYLAFLIALFFLNEPLRTIIVIFLFYIGLYLCLSDIISPVQLGELMSGRETPTEPFFLTVVEVALAVVIIFSLIKLSWKHVKYFGSVFVLILLLSEVIIIINGVLPNAGLLGMESRENTLSIPPENLTGRGNIYHITVDSYSSVIFLESLEKTNLAEDFHEFTFFEKNRSNYMFTEESLPSYMTGTFYKENDSLREWMERYKSSGVVNNLYDAGYEVSMYIPSSSGWGHPKASHVMVHEDVLKRYRSLSSFYHFADLWLLRVVPNFLQQEVYWEGKGTFTRLFVKDEVQAGKNAEVFGSVELMRQLISDEADRPDHGQYVYAHLWIPHAPYIMNRDCVFSSDCSYDEQVLCATRLIAELVSKLKELGRYHESIIILQSDHGPPSGTIPDPELPLDIKKRIEALDPQGFRVEQVESRTLALLLIKPPLESVRPLVISDRPTQLADIPATIYDLLDLPVHAEEGKSVFSPDFPHTREIHIFAGLRLQTDRKGEEYRFGVNLFEGEANHLSFTNGKGWKVYPNISVRWD